MATNYSVTLLVNGKEITIKSPSLLDAIRKIKPEYIKTKGVFTIKHGKRTAEQFLMIAPLKRLLANSVAQEIWAKRIDNALS